MNEVDNKNQILDTTLIMNSLQLFLQSTDDSYSFPEVISTFCSQCSKIELKLFQDQKVLEADLLSEALDAVKTSLGRKSAASTTFSNVVNLITVLNAIAQNQLPVSMLEMIDKEIDEAKKPVIELPTQDEFNRKELSALHRRIAYLEKWEFQHDKAREIYAESPNKSKAELARQLVSYIEKLNIERGTKAPIEVPKNRTAVKWFTKLKSGEEL